MEQSNIKFSVMSPVYNVEPYLAECIESVLNQSYGGFELILVDDGSTDRSGDICEEYAKHDSRIKVYHKPNGGLMNTRRYALERASGDYYVFLDSDDFLEPNSLEVLARHIGESDADLLIFGVNWLKGKSGVMPFACDKLHQGRVISDRRELYNIILNYAAYNSLCRKCVKASCFDGRDYSPYYRISRGEDLLQSLEVIENAERALFIPELLYNYRVNTDSITHSDDFSNFRRSFTTETLIQAMLKRSDVFRPEDYDRLRNHTLDGIMIQLKRISRFPMDRDSKRAAIASIRENDYFEEYLSQGYRSVPGLPGEVKTDALRAAQNRIVFRYLNAGRYDAVININSLLYRAAKSAGAR